jgi:hypothetical protein
MRYEGRNYSLCVAREWRVAFEMRAEIKKPSGWEGLWLNGTASSKKLNDE